ncbi:hypothetical protein [Streptomyces sp. NPDC057623]|uniref:hypothetical protein n=1 Tax=Streptomyces sp. NPDC057623 TaxID=3346187 RepID=UPI00369CC9A8
MIALVPNRVSEVIPLTSSLVMYERAPRNARVSLSKIHSSRVAEEASSRVTAMPWRPAASTASGSSCTPGILAAAL